MPKIIFFEICNHKFVEGFGCMCDAVTCTQCGLSEYPEAIPIRILISKIQNRFITENDPDWKSYFEMASRKIASSN